MENKIDMYYRFISDQEPSEEQLTFLMKEVCDDVRASSAKLPSIIQENIMREYQAIKKMFPELLFRANEGKLMKQYATVNDWAKLIFEEMI